MEAAIIIAIVIVLILIIVWIRAKNTKIIFFGRPSCPACIGFKPEWSKFVSALPIFGYSAEMIQSDLPENKEICENFGFATVPSVWKIHSDGSRYEFPSGLSRNSENLLRFAKAPGSIA